MLSYIIRRLLLIIPTLLGILLINFIIVQAAPGGPVEQIISQIKGHNVDATARIGGTDQGDVSSKNLNIQNQTTDISSKYRGSQGLDPEFIAELEKYYGFDKPPHERFFIMIKKYLKFDFGESYYKGKKVIDLILEKMPVSISLGLWTTLIVYLISIPLGIKKAIKDGSKFDIWTSAAIIIGYAIPGFLFAIFLVVFLAGGSFFDIFPLRGLVSTDWQSLNWFEKILDYLWHITLPVFSLVISGFATLAMLTKNSFMDEINKLYVSTAKAKGLSEKRVLYGHVFRNAMLIVIAGFPSSFIGILFSSSLFIEVIFSLDGLGLLGFEAALTRDYPVIFATLYFFSLLGLIMGILGDIMYSIIDPRIDFESRDN